MSIIVYVADTYVGLRAPSQRVVRAEISENHALHFASSSIYKVPATEVAIGAISLRGRSFPFFLFLISEGATVYAPAESDDVCLNRKDPDRAVPSYIA